MGNSLQVYIVEDSLILQRLLTSAIDAAGADAIGCSADAETAIADLFAMQPDVVVIDLSLKSGSGFDVLKALHEHNLASEAVKIVLTNHATSEYRAVCNLLGADRFFDKSMETAQALAFIGSLAAERQRAVSASRSSRVPVPA
jgi:two-component system, OmpR family, response regulator